MPSRKSVNNDGGAAYNFPTRELAQAIAKGSEDGALRLLLEVQTEIRKMLSQPGTGKLHSGLRYQSSAPGRPPAVQTGSLRNSWQTGQPRKRLAGSRISWALGSKSRYARRLEYGFGFLAARPYLRPAVAIVRPRAPKVMTAYVARAIKTAFPGMKR